MGNSQIFVRGRVNRKTLPHEKSWLWNQSKSKTVVPLNETESVTIAKFNPRKHPRTTIKSQPAYKLWVCQITSPNELYQNLHFLWIEKGKESEAAAPPLVKTVKQPKKKSCTLKLSEFSFLREFMDPQVACQLGWYETTPSTQLPTQMENSPHESSDNDCDSLFRPEMIEMNDMFYQPHTEWFMSY